MRANESFTTGRDLIELFRRLTRSSAQFADRASANCSKSSSYDQWLDMVLMKIGRDVSRDGGFAGIEHFQITVVLLGGNLEGNMQQMAKLSTRVLSTAEVAQVTNTARGLANFKAWR